MRRPSPHTTHQGPSRTGGLGESSNGSAEFGTVMAVQADRYTYTVRTKRGQNLQGVPRKRMSQNDVALLGTGTTVIIRHDLGFPYIDGVLDMPAAPADTVGIPTTGVEGFGGQGFDQTTNNTLGGYRGPSEPSDLIPGDHVLASASGARMGLLGGGVAFLRGSGLAQVRAHVLNDLVEIISRNFRHVTDMGVYEVKNKDGRVNMSFRGGSDQEHETGGDAENWTIRMDLGSEGDLFNFELTTPQGQTLFRLHVDANGRCTLFGLDGVVMQSGDRSGEGHVEEHGGASDSIVHGNRTDTTGGDYTETVQGTHTETVDGNSTTSVGSDYQVQAVRDVGVTAGRNMTITAVGDPTQPGTALNTKVQNGHYEISVGQQAYPIAGFYLKTYKGAIDFTSQYGGNIRFTTRAGMIQGDARKVTFSTYTPDSVVLGGNALVSHVVKYEQFEILMKTLFRLFDSHAHPVTAVGSLTGAPAIPVGTALATLVRPCKSQRVGVGA